MAQGGGLYHPGKPQIDRGLVSHQAQELALWPVQCYSPFLRPLAAKFYAERNNEPLQSLP